MNLVSAHPFWSIRNGLPKSYPSVESNLTCEVLVVGGGITGALVAYHLVEAGIHTALIDRRDIGTGSTSGSTALLQYEIDVPLRQLWERLGEYAAARSYLLCLEAVEKLEGLVRRLRLRCGFANRPSVQLARFHSELPELRQEVLLRHKLGIAVDYWSEHDLKQRFPFNRPGALFSEKAGQLDPHQFTHQLLAAGATLGLQIYDRTGSAGMSERHGGIQVTTDSGFRIRARRVVLATGFEARELLRSEAGTLKSTYAFISEPRPETTAWYRNSLIWETGSPYLYLRTTTDQRIIVGGEDVPFVNAHRRDSLISAKCRALRHKYQRLFPGTKLEPAYAWAGTFSETKDGLAYIGVHPRFPNAYFALGYGGNGITFSLIAAEIIRDAILDRPNSAADLFRFGR